LLLVQKRSPFRHSSPTYGQQSQLVNDRNVFLMHSNVHLVASNVVAGNGQLLPNASSLYAVPEQYFVLKPAMSVPDALAAQVYVENLGQQSQSGFNGSSQSALH
jgi:hypothetical protein